VQPSRRAQRPSRRPARWWVVVLLMAVTWAAMCWLIYQVIASARL
jgi:hypothetical protein